MSVYIQDEFFGYTYDLDHLRIAHDRVSGTVSSSTETAGYADGNAATVRVDSAWRPTALPANWSTVLSSATTLSYVGIAAHDLGTQGASITIQTTTDGGSTWDTVTGLSALTPDDDSAILCLFEPVSADGYRVIINSADAVPTIAVIAAGDVMEWPRPCVWTGTPITEGDQISFANNQSETGAWLGRTRVSDGLRFQVQVSNLSEDFRAGDFKAFKAYANGENAAFFIALRPGYYPDEVAYAVSSDVVRMSRDQPNRRISGSVTMNLSGYRQDLG